ncbi:hypothetical protein [Sphingosinicella sp. YJ22]|uniref:hypothetical protein n=1 Tax=Sphingosinicella sp. YJ22 TaxID=1104780 RepID=UPI00140E0000|nr:hypothetical protein [Sphingosinicella sp. YJ22]
MAKKKSGKKSAKAPKEIAGIKLPKPLREPAAQLLKAVQSPAFADVAAAALLSAAAALQGGKKASASGDPATPRTGKSKAVAATTAGALGAMLATKAIEGVTKLAADKGGNGATPAGSGRARKKS